jgi:GTP cyclohydrolase I
MMSFHLDHDEVDVRASLELHKRSVSEAQMERFEGYIAEIFTACGLALDTPSTYETPRRFLNALFEATEGYDGDPKLIKLFEAEYREGADRHLSQIIEGPIPFFALCEHHAFPFYGQGYIGYIANEHILGISKLTRLMRLFSKRFAVQERLGQQVVDALETILQPYGAAVYLEACHLCLQMRGVRETESLTRTTFWRGEYEHNPALRDEFLQMASIKR